MAWTAIVPAMPHATKSSTYFAATCLSRDAGQGLISALLREV